MVTDIDIQSNRNKKQLLKAYEELYPVIKAAREQANTPKIEDVETEKDDEQKPEPVLAYDKNSTIESNEPTSTQTWKA